MNLWLIIAAAGQGLRMQGNEPKQFALLRNKPVIIYSLEKFNKLFPQIRIIVSIQKSYFDWFIEHKTKYKILQDILISEGGSTRFDSVKNALGQINQNGFVAIHDAARPLLSENLIKRLFDDAFSNGNAIPATDLKESIRKIEKNQSISLNRNDYKLIQTPQIFRTNEIKMAYNQAIHSEFTDDASVMEAAGYRIFLSKGEENNIKLTYPIDFQIAELLL